MRVNHKKIDLYIVPVQKPGVRLEVFDKEALLLIIDNRELIELDEIEYWIWKKVDGKRTIMDIATLYSQDFGENQDNALLEIWTFFRKFFQYHSVLDIKRNKGEIVDIQKKYVQNTHVCIRKEDAYGSLLLHNPTGQVKLLNKTGSYIWNQCKKENTFDKLKEAFKRDFDLVLKSQVQIENEIQSFLNQMVESGFIKVYRDPETFEAFSE